MPSPKPLRFACPFCFSPMTVQMQNLSSQTRGVKRIIRHMKRHQKMFQQAANRIAREIPMVRWRLAKARAGLQLTNQKR